MLNNRKKFSISKAGFTLVEVLIACSIISVSTLSLMHGAQKGITLSSDALSKSQASFLLEEGAEAVKSIRDDNWVTISNLSLNTPYYLFFNTATSKWELVNSNLLVDDIFERSITVSSVERNSDDDIVASGGTEDLGTKKVVVTVSWNSSGRQMSKSLSFYLADIFN